MGIPALEGGLFVNLLIFDYLYIEIGGAGYRSVDGESCSYELTLVVGSGSGLQLRLVNSRNTTVKMFKAKSRIQFRF